MAALLEVEWLPALQHISLFFAQDNESQKTKIFFVFNGLQQSLLSEAG
ncbi:MAG: hypothetical protein JSR74_06765 [Proteobacteria bacterium]|nr:hypothetical protein [Pseudomonadota bacterium]